MKNVTSLNRQCIGLLLIIIKPGYISLNLKVLQFFSEPSSRTKEFFRVRFPLGCHSLFEFTFLGIVNILIAEQPYLFKQTFVELIAVKLYKVIPFIYLYFIYFLLVYKAAPHDLKYRC